MRRNAPGWYVVFRSRRLGTWKIGPFATEAEAWAVGRQKVRGYAGAWFEIKLDPAFPNAVRRALRMNRVATQRHYSNRESRVMLAHWYSTPRAAARAMRSMKRTFYQWQDFRVEKIEPGRWGVSAVWPFAGPRARLALRASGRKNAHRNTGRVRFNGRQRVYFYDGAGREIAHPFTGREISGTGAYLVRDGIAYMNVRLSFYLREGRGAEERKVTAADFGGRTVIVKWWWPGGQEVFALTARKPGDKELSEVPDAALVGKKKVELPRLGGRPNPPVGIVWERASRRQRAHILTFAGFDPDQAEIIAGFPWRQLSGRLQRTLAGQWQENRRGRRLLTRAEQTALHRRRYARNPLTSEEARATLCCAETHFHHALSYLREGKYRHAAAELGAAIAHANTVQAKGAHKGDGVRAMHLKQKYLKVQAMVLRAEGQPRTTGMQASRFGGRRGLSVADMRTLTGAAAANTARFRPKTKAARKLLSKFRTLGELRAYFERGLAAHGRVRRNSDVRGLRVMMGAAEARKAMRFA